MQHDRSPFREYCGLTAVSWPSPQVPSGDHSMREPASVKPCNGSRPSTVRCSSPEYQPRLRRRPLTSVMLCMLCVLCVWSTLNQNRPPYTAGHPCKGRGIPTQGTSRVVGSHSRYTPPSLQKSTSSATRHNVIWEVATLTMRTQQTKLSIPVSERQRHKHHYCRSIHRQTRTVQKGHNTACNIFKTGKQHGTLPAVLMATARSTWLPHIETAVYSRTV